VNESQVFANALKLATPAERAAYLDEVCAGNPQLRADVEALLRAHANDPGFLEHRAGPIRGTEEEAQASGSPIDPRAAAFTPAEGPGVVLAGRYKLLEAIGEGGMGTVWMAQQTEPVKRLVAVKLIKAGMDSAQVLARFEAERQALALMDHPNIATVLDAGATPEGRPFFVMELVKGVPITKYCDEHRLTPRQRLQLFVPVCQAIQHAHHKGIIHRDVKPSNVLVAQYDDRPVPKVIDFGVAKATGQQLTEQTLHTGFGAVVGTVEYMSPEQASFNQLDVDTRSDIYSLGVLLYELLTGSPPFSRKELEKAGVLEMLRVIREQEPSKPSTKLSTAEGLPTLAANRGTEPKRLTALVRGELDWIVMKALEKDRSGRYETANGFAMDLQRYLVDEPVQAGPPSARYRLKKFLRRNKGMVATAGIIVALLLLGTLATLVTGLIYNQHLQRALTDVAEQKQAVADARTDADRLREEARKTNEAAGQRLARSAVTAAFREWERNDAGAALPLLAEAVRADAGDADRQLVHRTRFRAFLHQHPRLVQMWFTGSNGAAFSPDGRRVVTADVNGTARVWDVASGEAITPPMPHHGPVTEASFSRDGRRVLTRASVPLTRDPERAPAFAASLVGFAAAPPRGQLLLGRLAREAVGGLPPLRWHDWDEARVWDADTGQPLTPPLRHRADGIAVAAFGPDSRQVITAAYIRGGGPGLANIRIWDADGGRLFADLPKLLDDLTEVVPSPDGGRLALIRNGGEKRPGGLRFWDVTTQQFVGKLVELSDFVSGAFDPTGSRFLCFLSRQRDVKGLLEAWDVATGQRLFEPIPLDRRVAQIVWSPDGRRFATALGQVEGRGSALVRVWDAASGKPVRTPWEHPGEIQNIAFSPDGGRVVTVAPIAEQPDGFFIIVRRVEDDTPVFKPLYCATGVVNAVAFHPNGRLLLIAGAYPIGEQGEVSVWDVVTNQPLARLPEATARQGRDSGWEFSRFSPDARRLLTRSGDWNTAARLWDATTGRPITPLIPQRGSCRPLENPPTFSPDGRMVLTYPYDEAGRRSGLQLWNVSDGRLIYELPLEVIDVREATFTPDGPRVLISDQERKVGWWDPTTGGTKFFPVQRVKFRWHEALFSPRGDRILVVVGDGTGRLWDRSTGQPVGPPLKAGDMRLRLFSPDGGRLLLGAGSSVQLWDTTTGSAIAEPVPHVDKNTSPVFSPDGAKLLTWCDAEHVRVWDTATGQPLSPPLPHEAWWPADFSPADRLVLRDPGDEMVRVFDAAGRPLTPPLSHQHESGHPAISPDGRLLLTVTDDLALAVWDLPAGRPAFPPLKSRFASSNQFVDEVNAVAFSPDGRWIIAHDSTNWGDATTVWDAATGWPLAPGFLPPLSDQPFSPDGRRLLGGRTETHEVYDLSPDERPAEVLVRLARLLTGRRLDEGFITISPLSADERRQLWQELHSRYPEEFAPPGAEQMLTWHRQNSASADLAQRVWHFDRLMALEPKNGMHYVHRAEIRTEQQEWDAAEADLRRAAELNADSSLTWHQLALLRLRAGDAAGYRRACEELIRRHPEDAASSWDWSKGIPTVALAPCERLDLMPLLRELERLKERNKWADRTIGLYQYRLGRFAESARSLEAARKQDRHGGKPWDWFFLAMALHRSGNAAEAKRSFAKAAADIARSEKDDRSRWDDRFTLQLLKAEAERVLRMGQHLP
jgi:WD40 repeat protein/serine/threonine protein kinase